MTQLEEKGLLNVFTQGVDGFRRFFIVIAPSVFSIIASQRNEFLIPPVAKLPQLNQKRYIKYEVKYIDVYMFL